jgi:hypothetical protein
VLCLGVDTVLIQFDGSKRLLTSYCRWFFAHRTRLLCSVNRELLQLYWFIAEQTVQKQQTARWGDGLIKQVSQDLQQEFPEIKRFSVRNLTAALIWAD